MTALNCYFIKKKSIELTLTDMVPKHNATRTQGKIALTSCFPPCPQ